MGDHSTPCADPGLATDSSNTHARGRNAHCPDSSWPKRPGSRKSHKPSVTLALRFPVTVNSNWHIAWCEAVTSRAGHEGQESVERRTSTFSPCYANARFAPIAAVNTLLRRNPCSVILTVVTEIRIRTRLPSPALMMTHIMCVAYMHSYIYVSSSFSTFVRIE